MKSKFIVFSIFLIFIIVFGMGVISAQDADNFTISDSQDSVDDLSTTNSGVVSGDVAVVTNNSGSTSGELSYNIPSDAKTIKSADVYVNVYSGSAENRYGANANVSISTINGKTNYSESLWIKDGSTDGTVYVVNDHTTKCYSDYMIHYDITNLLTGLNGSSLKINVDTFKIDDKQFDGRIKLIGLILAYDDGDDDSIYYYVNDTQLWSKSNVNVTFATESLTNFYGASLTNIVLSSADGTYRINNNLIGDADVHNTGSFYYQYNKWNDVTSLMEANQKTTLNAQYVGTSTYGSIKNVLSVLTVNNIIADVSVKTEYANTCYAGTNNTLTVTVNTNKAGKYIVRLLADNVEVNQSEFDLINGSNTLFITDSTIRAVDENTVNGASNNKVNYTVELIFNNKNLSSSSISVPVLYNGNLGKDLAYPAGGFDAVTKFTVDGDILIDVKGDSTYLGGSNLNRTDVWTISLGDDSNIVKSFVYVPYNWFNSNLISEDINMFNATFNGVKVVPVAMYRDQSNLGNYGKYGYGVLIYDVTDLINKSGENSFNLTKLANTPAVYPSVLIYMYNTTGSSTIKEIYLSNGADLLAGTSSNVAKRPVHSDSAIDVNSKFTSSASLYIFAAGAQSGEGNIVFNGNADENVWSGSSKTTDLYTLDVTDQIKDSNSISFVATGSTILALQQMVVLTKNADSVSMALASEYANTCYAGTNNAISVTISVVRSGNHTVELYADGVKVNSTDVNLISGENKIVLIDPTIRAVDESTVNGAANKKVNYTVNLIYSNAVVTNTSLEVPVLYNGNLGKDLAYPAQGYEPFFNASITGDIVIDVKDDSTYLGGSNLNRTDVWAINLDSKSSIVKSFVYVPYNWFNSNLISEDINMFNATFNGVKVVPVAMYRDQGNLGKYGKYGYGVLVYDVTDLIDKSGENSFNLTKLANTPAVYPSVLIYMYDTAGSAVIKNVFISNGADLLAGTSYNIANRPVHSDSVIDAASVADISKLYIFAAGAQSGEGNIVFNNMVYENVWSGSSKSSDLYTLDITKTIKDSNNISFVATGSTILALQQIIVTTQKAKTQITAPSVTTKYNTKKNLVVTLKDSKGNAIANAKVTIVLNGKSKVVTTKSNGQAVLAIPTNLVPKTYKVSITYAGDGTHIKSSASTKVIVKKASVKLTAKKKTFKAKKKTKKYTVTLKNNKNKAMKKVKLTLKVKGKKYTATTNKKGKAKFNLKKLTKKGKYTAKITYKGNKYFKKVTKKVRITVKK